MNQIFNFWNDVILKIQNFKPSTGRPENFIDPFELLLNIGFGAFKKYQFQDVFVNLVK